MKTLALTVVLAVAAPTVHAGRIAIGRDTLVGGTKAGTCHMTTFTGPEDAVASYVKSQKERFEEPDPAVIDSMKKGVWINLEVVTHKQPTCAQNSGTPERIILTEKKGTTPLITIPLTAKPVKLGNLAGAEFEAMEATGTLPLDELRRMTGKEYDFHLIYSDHKYKDDWKKDYAEKILKK